MRGHPGRLPSPGVQGCAEAQWPGQSQGITHPVVSRTGRKWDDYGQALLCVCVSRSSRLSHHQVVHGALQTRVVRSAGLLVSIAGS